MHCGKIWIFIDSLNKQITVRKLKISHRDARNPYKVPLNHIWRYGLSHFLSVKVSFSNCSENCVVFFSKAVIETYVIVIVPVAVGPICCSKNAASLPWVAACIWRHLLSETRLSQACCSPRPTSFELWTKEGALQWTTKYCYINELWLPSIFFMMNFVLIDNTISYEWQFFSKCMLT